jgi:hypothetical protein
MTQQKLIHGNSYVYRRTSMTDPYYNMARLSCTVLFYHLTVNIDMVVVFPGPLCPNNYLFT